MPAAVRTVDPCGLVNAAGTWYLAARHRNRVRFYHVQRIDSLTVLDEPAQVLDTFDLAQAWTTARASWQADQAPVVATVEVRSDAVGD
ncbi:MAG: WYL domain-containing protein, partial [Cellulomonas sp.]|nr:WYL domain-containing protein [Cellulomonas sp.]